MVTNSCAIYTLHARLRVRRAPGIPHALCLGEGFMHNSGASRRGKADSHPKLVRRYCEAKRQSNPGFYFAAQTQTMDCFFDLISSMFYQKSHLRGLPISAACGLIGLQE